MRRKLTAFFLLLLPLLAGCWNKAEVEEIAYVLLIGLDQGPENLYRMTVAIARPDKLAGKDGGSSGGGGGKSEGDKPYLLVTVDAPTLTSALSMLNGFMGRTVSLHHTRALLVSEELARTSGVKALDEILRFPQTRRTIAYMVTREPAGELLKKMDTKMDKNPARSLEQLTYNYRNNGMLPVESQINSFISRGEVNSMDPLTYYAALVGTEDTKLPRAKTGAQSEAGYRSGDLPREGGANIEAVGAAAFRGGTMVGVLTGEQVRYVLMLQDRFQKTYTTFRDPRDPNAYVGVELRRGRPIQTQVSLAGGRPRIRSTITLEAELVATQSGVDYTEPEFQRELEQAMVQQMTGPIQALIRQTQEWRSDVVGFGRSVVTHFPTVEAWSAYNWPERYPNAEISVDVRVKLRRFGLTLSPATTVR